VQDEQEEVPDGEYQDLSTAFRMLSFENPAGRPPEAPRMAKPKKRTGPCRKQSEEPASEASEAPEKAAPEPACRRRVRRGALWGRGRGRVRGRGAKSRGRGRGRGRGRRASPQKSLSPSSERTPEETSSSEAASGEEAEDAEESAPAPTVRRSKRQAASKPVNYQESDEGDAEDMDLDED